MHTLADKLDAIALNKTFDGEALYAAKHHDATTYNDLLMLRRYMFGIHTSIDHISLQELANHIREYDNVKEHA